ncbi:MAG: hypothetical protein GC164_14915 [Phycisphaera sp.]|nr:hypothetical protein [Phycisphaera sp.]
MSSPRRLLRRIEHPGHGRYLTFSCYHRLPLLNNDRIRDLLVERLTYLKSKQNFRLYAWVFMPEHVHLLLQTASVDLTVEKILNTLKARFAQQVIGRWWEINAPILQKITDPRGVTRFWQAGGGYDRNIVSDHESFEKIDYIHNNPVRRGLVKTPTDWKWSSARWYAGDLLSGPSMDPL